LIFLFIGAFAGYIAFQNSRLQNIIAQQDQLIKKANHDNGSYLDRARNYKDSVKTITERISFLMGNKKMTSDQFIQLYNTTSEQRDSLAALLSDERFLFNYAKDQYGFNVFLYKNNDTTIASSKLSRADSAKIAFKYFKGRLKRTNNGWEINTFGNEADQRKIKTLYDKAKEIISSDSSKKP